MSWLMERHVSVSWIVYVLSQVKVGVTPVVMLVEGMVSVVVAMAYGVGDVTG